MMKICPNCEKLTEFKKNPSNYGLFTWHEGVNGITVDIQQFMPVKIENCGHCGYLNIFFDTSQQHRAK